ncbi:MAG: hypothetical protein KME31_02575 [Tolypothrix carrinoi HA7290-LM1]|nr:hypothetical protein [Tolypothrix carrinoi HA7290-LM1]
MDKDSSANRFNPFIGYQSSGNTKILAYRGRRGGWGDKGDKGDKGVGRW